MSSATPRKSIDSLASGASTPSLSQFSLNQIESPRTSTQRYPLRRGSTASSIASIGGILDPSHRHGSIAESGQNGTTYGSEEIYEENRMLIRRSHLYSPATSHCPHRSSSPYRCPLRRIQAPNYSRYTSCHIDQHSTCGSQSVRSLLVAGWVVV